MRPTTFIAAAMIMAAGPALAGGGAPVPQTPEGGPPSGRPTAILDDAKCQEIWGKAQSDAAPYLLNFQMADADKDGSISEAEFKDACGKGWVQEEASLPVDSGGGQTPERPTQVE